MIEIFIALFGGIYFISKIFSERGSHKNYTKRANSWEQNLVTWRRLVTHRDIEEEIEDYVKKNFTKKEFRENIEEICSVLPPGSRTVENYIRILLAKKGLISHSDGVGGFRVECLGVSDTRSIIDVRRDYQAFIEYCKWLDRTLHENGFTAKMMFVPNCPDSNEKRFYSIYEVDKTSTRSGNIKWEPQIIHAYI